MVNHRTKEGTYYPAGVTWSGASIAHINGCCPCKKCQEYQKKKRAKETAMKEKADG